FPAAQQFTDTSSVEVAGASGVASSAAVQGTSFAHARTSVIGNSRTGDLTWNVASVGALTINGDNNEAADFSPASGGPVILTLAKIGRASCRGRVTISLVARRLARER